MPGKLCLEMDWHYLGCNQCTVMVNVQTFMYDYVSIIRIDILYEGESAVITGIYEALKRYKDESH